MKKILIIILIAALSSCSGIDENDIIGKWMIIKAEVFNGTLTPDVLEAVKEEAVRNYYYFYDDNNFKVKTKNKKAEGKWRFDSELKKIKISHRSRYGEKFKEEYTVVSIEGDIMKWSHIAHGDHRIRLILRKEKDF